MNAILNYFFTLINECTCTSFGFRLRGRGLHTAFAHCGVCVLRLEREHFRAERMPSRLVLVSARDAVPLHASHVLLERLLRAAVGRLCVCLRLRRQRQQHEPVLRERRVRVLADEPLAEPRGARPLRRVLMRLSDRSFGCTSRRYPRLETGAPLLTCRPSIAVL